LEILRGNTLKKTCVLTNGCPENQLDSGRVKTYLEGNGWQIADNVTDADLILFNACALTQPLELNSIHLIQDIKKQIKDDQRLIVWGCLPKIDPKTLFQTHQELSFGEREVGKLDEVIKATTSINEVTANEIFRPVSKTSIRHRLRKLDRLPIKLLYLPYLRLTAGNYLYRRDDPSIFYIKIASGCLGNCSYCAVKKSRGNIKSKPIDEVMDEFKAGSAVGSKSSAYWERTWDHMGGTSAMTMTWQTFSPKW
jgi:tRNA A37 methylthiotransferase MiaB